MPKLLKNTICLLLLSFTISCDNADAPFLFRKAGKTVEREIYTGNYQNVTINSFCKLYLFQDTVNKVIAKYGENLIDDVKIKKEDNCIIFEDKTKVNWIRGNDNKLEIHLHTKNLNSLKIQAPCVIKSENEIISNKFALYFQTDAVEADININTAYFFFENLNHNTANLNLKGSITKAVLNLYGTVKFDARNLIIKNAEIKACSENSSYINVSDTLNIGIYSGGNIFCVSEPKIIRQKENSRKQNLLRMKN